MNLEVRACSGGVTADFAQPRSMEDTQTKVQLAPAGVTTTDQAKTWLEANDPCNSRQFPDEEFWRYRPTRLLAGTMTYECSRFVRPQVNHVTADKDLVVFTMGGNDAGFVDIVQHCFVTITRTASKCRTVVEHARSMVPTIKQRLIDNIDLLRARGLRNDAKIVQLGYPYLQVDDNFTLPSVSGPYPAGNEVRKLIADAMAEFGKVADVANASVPGQFTFVGNVAAKFAGHEPDAAFTNPDAWIVEQAGNADLKHWYHPNAKGQAAYAELLLAGGTFGAVPTPTIPTPSPGPTPSTGPTTPPATQPVRVRMRVRVVDRTLRRDQRAVLRVRIARADDSTPRGRIVVRLKSGKRLAVKRLRAAHDGRRVLRLRGLKPGVRVLKIRYRDASGVHKSATRRVTVRR